MNSYQKQFAELTSVKACTLLKKKLVTELDSSSRTYAYRCDLIFSAANQRSEAIKQLKLDDKLSKLTSYQKLTGIYC